MREEKHEKESRDLPAEAVPFTKQEVVKDDGRRLTFYTFPVTDLKDNE